MKHIPSYEEFLNEGILNEARAIAISVVPENFGETMWQYYKVQGETNTWRVHSGYFNDQTTNASTSDRDVLFFEAMAFPTGKIIIGAGAINNAKKTNGSTIGKNFGTTADEFNADPKGVSQAALDEIISKDQQKIFTKFVKSQGETFKFKFVGDFTKVIEELVTNALK